MRRVVWAKAAVRDLGRIRAVIAVSNPSAAARMVERLEAAAESLAEFPDRGQKMRGLLRRLTTVRPYLIIYHVGENVVEVMHVRHGARRPA